MNIIEDIKSNGYWRVIIKPNEYTQDKISMLSECREIIVKNKVSVRGWDFPFLNEKSTKNFNNYISSDVYFGDIKEYWRYYQSGQFIYLGATREDYMLDKIRPIVSYTIHNNNEIDFKTQKFFNIEILIHKVYEIYEFALRLCSKELLNDTFSISIELFKMQNRVLFFFQRDRMMLSIRQSNSDNISFEKEYKSSKYINSYKIDAIYCINYIFERFAFHLDENIIKEIQPHLK